MYFKISRSVNKHGPYKWYWYLHQDSKHIFHISNGYECLDDCIADLQLQYPLYASKLGYGSSEKEGSI